jgi:hypothetical protein
MLVPLEKKNNIPEIKEMEERDYWEQRGPLTDKKVAKTNQPVSKDKRESFLSIRLSGSEITELRDLASKYNSGPSTLARNILVYILNKMKTPNDNTPQTITMNDLFQGVASTMPQGFLDRYTDLYKSATIGDEDNPSMLIMSQSQLKEAQDMGKSFVVNLIRLVNPNLKLVTPEDENYEKIKSLTH